MEIIKLIFTIFLLTYNFLHYYFNCEEHTMQHIIKLPNLMHLLHNFFQLLIKNKICTHNFTISIH